MNRVDHTNAPTPLGEVGIKICGMKYNPQAVAALQPDYLGFIFYGGSKRNFTEEVPMLPTTVKKIGVFVDAPLDFVAEKVEKFQLDGVQLHGEESPGYCRSINEHLNTFSLGKGLGGDVSIWKVFSIKETFNFDQLIPYEPYVDAFLFDTKGAEKGGNGYTFNWNVLEEYPSQKPFVLSGGIGLEEISAIQDILKTNLPILAIDINSKFEIEPGLKKIDDLHILISELKNNGQ
ncbi:phosphoribosylanthranilate isomerase [Marinirhabdus gelatinilytica]|uniref:N-(5'-phosphoribosyl)anthranilate isomerase n=1 Tax=Marinirhabdus gelatinilytica TaxID=1703343 RepID=A0A370Q4G9_9FLAO|nr:phosphoribosylanthranilate isomerase [Marinirhabdus gelatinilytica]RDK83276.1 phosphoribosylanthranilate isomerase [Marinirhabdus gelatinilytica]